MTPTGGFWLAEPPCLPCFQDGYRGDLSCMACALGQVAEACRPQTSDAVRLPAHFRSKQAEQGFTSHVKLDTGLSQQHITLR